MLTEYRNIIYDELMATLRKAVRNGNWRKRRFLDKALYRAAMGYARYGRSIVKGKLVEKLFRVYRKVKGDERDANI